MAHLQSIICIAFASLHAAIVGANEVGNCVLTNQGQVCGFEEQVLNKTVVSHLGIPFAQPPLGTLRFHAPQPLAQFNGTIDGTKPGKGCLQNHQMGQMVKMFAAMQPVEADTSEDCLFLDVRAPKDAQNLPVMVNIHGGGFMMGSGSIPIYCSPAFIALGNVICVSMNYRLGVLGFGYLGNDEMPGNMGLLDQRMALQWVKDNIISFGGDPGQVTVLGESAGGGSVSMHLVANESRKLFQGAIVQSGVMYNMLKTEEVARENVVKLAQQLSCGTASDSEILECLRAAPGKSLQVAVGLPLEFYPVTPDATFFGGDAFDQLFDSSFADLKIMIGYNKDESSLFLPIHTGFAVRYDNIDEWQIPRQLYHGVARREYGAGADNATVNALLAEYDGMANLSDVQRLTKMMSDFTFICPTLRFTRILSRTNPNGVYMYRFDYISPETVVMPTGLGATHGSEVPLTFGVPLIDNPSLPWGADDKTIAREMVEYWSNMAKHGPLPYSWAPSPDWPPVTSSKDTKMRIIQLGSSEVTTEHSERICKLMGAINPNYRLDEV